MLSRAAVLAILVATLSVLPAADPASLGRKLLASNDFARTQAMAEWASYSNVDKRQAAPIILRSLRGGLQSRNPATLRAALSGIALLGPFAKESVPDLIELCRQKTSSDGDVCGLPVETALAQIGPAAFPDLLALQGRGDRTLPLFAIHAIAAMKAGASEMQPGVLALSETALRCNTQATWNALEALRQLGPVAAPSTPALIRLIENPCPIPEQSLDGDQDSEMAFSGSHAIIVLGAIGPLAINAVPTILEAVPIDPDDAIHALAQIGRPAIPYLLKTLHSAHEVFREASARVFSEMGPRAIEASPALQRTLEDNSPRVRAAAAHALIAIGPQNITLLQRIAKLLFDTDSMVRLETADVLHLGKPSLAVLPEFIRALDDSEAEVRLRIIDDIGSLGSLARSAVPDMLPLLKDPNESVRQTAALALAALGAPEKMSVSRLVATLSDEDVRLRRAAADLLGQMGPDASSALPALKIASQDIDPDVQKVAKRAIDRIQAPMIPESVLPDNES